MRSRVVIPALLGAAVLQGTGCANRPEMKTWREHPTHFASGDHLYFSVRNREGGSPRVNRKDIALARQEGWWGQPVMVSQERILER